MLNNALDTLDKCWSTLEDIINPHYLDVDAWMWEALQQYYKSRIVRFFILVLRWKLSTLILLVLEIGTGKSGSSVLNNRDIVTLWAFMFCASYWCWIKINFLCRGQTVPPEGHSTPVFKASALLDFELEMVYSLGLLIAVWNYPQRVRTGLHGWWVLSFIAIFCYAVVCEVCCDMDKAQWRNFY